MCNWETRGYLMNTIKIGIELKPDSKGYLDRECPKCHYLFKVFKDDWIKKCSDESIYCPHCGESATSDQWVTSEQKRQLNKRAISYAKNYVMTELNKAMSNIASRSRNSFIKIEYKPFQPAAIDKSPILSLISWETDLTCTKCGCRYSVRGKSYFCPWCGYSSPKEHFLQSIKTVEKNLFQLEKIRKLFEEEETGSGYSAVENLIEDCLKNIVSSFQDLSFHCFSNTSNTHEPTAKFQSIKNGNNLFEQQVGIKYLDVLIDEEFNWLNIMFNRRHLLEHTNGIVDKAYLEKSGDMNYKIGQRVIISEHDIQKMLPLIKKLGTYLIENTIRE